MLSKAIGVSAYDFDFNLPFSCDHPQPVIREFVPLVAVAGAVPGKVQPSVEYRRSWIGSRAGSSNATERAVSDRRLCETKDDRWIVIECTDAQEAGYAGVQPQLLWRRILEQIDG